jgi:hypothetical protein
MPTTSLQAHASSERMDAEAALLEGLAFERLLADLSACFADVFNCDFPIKIEQSYLRLSHFSVTTVAPLPNSWQGTTSTCCARRPHVDSTRCHGAASIAHYPGF